MKKPVVMPTVLASLIALACSLSMTACGGGDHNGSTPAQASGTGTDTGTSQNPSGMIGADTKGAQDSGKFQQASCPDSVPKLNMSNSLLQNANLGIGPNDDNRFNILVGDAVKNLVTCIVKPEVPGYTPPPAEAQAVLNANSANVSVHLIATSEFSKVRQLVLSLVKSLDEDTPSEQVNLYKVVAYTQNDTGAWERAVLETSLFNAPQKVYEKGLQLRFIAPAKKVGYYTIEKIAA